jgi:hypothetical protein
MFELLEEDIFVSEDVEIWANVWLPTLTFRFIPLRLCQGIGVLNI